MKVGDLVVVRPGEATSDFGGVLEEGDVCLVEGTDIGIGDTLFLTVRTLRTGAVESAERVATRFELLEKPA